MPFLSFFLTVLLLFDMLRYRFYDYMQFQEHYGYDGHTHADTRLSVAFLYCILTRSHKYVPVVTVMDMQMLLVYLHIRIPFCYLASPCMFLFLCICTYFCG